MQAGCDAIVKVLLAAGANVNAATCEGDRPLHLAADRGDAAAVAELLRAGADVNAATFEGERPLHVAAATGDAATVAELLRAGADVSATDNMQYTSAALSCFSGACRA